MGMEASKCYLPVTCAKLVPNCPAVSSYSSGLSSRAVQGAGTGKVGGQTSRQQVREDKKIEREEGGGRGGRGGGRGPKRQGRVRAQNGRRSRRPRKPGRGVPQDAWACGLGGLFEGLYYIELQEVGVGLRFSVEFFSLFVEFQCLKTVVRNEDLPPAGQSGSAWLQACHPSMIEISCPGVCRSSSIHRCFRRHMTVNSHQPRICQSQVSHPGASKPLNLKGFKAERDHSLSLKWFTFYIF